MHAKQNKKMSHIWHIGIPRASKYVISFPLFGELWKFQMFGFLLVPVKQIKKGHSDNLELSESSDFAVKGILCSEFWFFFAPYIFSVTHRIMLGRQGGKMCASAYEAYQVLRMCFKH